jgi:hypothetical protein
MSSPTVLELSSDLFSPHSVSAVHGMRRTRSPGPTSVSLGTLTTLRLVGIVSQTNGAVDQHLRVVAQMAIKRVPGHHRGEREERL